jgi:hypothetical protein
MAACGTKLLRACALVCPELVEEADLRALGRHSAYDPLRTSYVQRT